MDYAVQAGVSLSTLRRYIKAGKIEFKIEKGRYLIAHSEPTAKPAAEPRLTDSSAALMRADGSATSDRMRALERDLLKAREEIGELKTLIALYEEGLSHPPRSQ